MNSFFNFFSFGDPEENVKEIQKQLIKEKKNEIDQLKKIVKESNSQEHREVLNKIIMEKSLDLEREIGKSKKKSEYKEKVVQKIKQKNPKKKVKRKKVMVSNMQKYLLI